MKKNTYVIFLCVVCIVSPMFAETFTLETAILTALENNPNVMMQLHAVKAAQHQIQSARAPSDVTIRASAQYQDASLPIDVADTTNSTISNNGTSFIISSHDTDTIQGSVSLEKNFVFGLQTKLSFETESVNEKYQFASDISKYSEIEKLYDPDRCSYGTVQLTMTLPLLKSFSNSLVKNDIRTAESCLQQQQIILENTIADVVSSVSASYWNHVANVNKYNLTVNILENLEKRRERLRQLIEIGSSSQSEMIVLVSSIEKQSVEKILHEQALLESAAALAAAVGCDIPDNALFTIDIESMITPTVLHNTDISDADKMTMTAYAVNQNAKIRIAEETLMQAELAWRKMKAASHPDFDMFFTIGHKGTRYDNDPIALIKSFTENLNHIDFSGGIMFSARLPNNAKGASDAAYENFLQSQLSLEDTKRQFARNLNIEFSSVQKYAHAVQKNSHVVALYKQIVEGERKRFDAGIITVDDLYSMEESNKQTFISYLDTCCAYMASVLKLKQTLGIMGNTNAYDDLFSAAVLYSLQKSGNANIKNSADNLQ